MSGATEATVTSRPGRRSGDRPAWRSRRRRARPGAIVRLVVLAAIPLGLACGDAGPVLTVYSPHGRTVLEGFERRFEEGHPGVDLQWIDMGTQEVLDRIRSERANPQADVWFGGPAAFFETAAESGLLSSYRPGWADAVPPEARGSDDLYVGVWLTPMVIAYNSEALSREEAPADWDEILDPRWDDEVLIRDPLASGTMRTIFGMVMDRGLRETGDTTAGWEWLRRLDGQTKEYVLNPALLYQKLARGEGLVTLWDMPDILTVREQGFPIDYVIPESGTPILVDAIAVVAGASEPELAREFVDHVGTVEAQIWAAREFFRIPARTDLPTDSIPDWLRDARDGLEPMPLDWDMIESRGAEWMRYWDAQVRNSRR